MSLPPYGVDRTMKASAPPQPTYDAAAYQDQYQYQAPPTARAPSRGESRGASRAGGSRAGARTAAPSNGFGAIAQEAKVNGGGGGPGIQNGSYGLLGEPVPEQFNAGQRGEFVGIRSQQPPGGKSNVILG